jgi:hypothetical protein
MPQLPPRTARLLSPALLAVVLAAVVGCRGTALKDVPARPLPVLYAADHPFDVPGDAGGRADTSGLTVFGFSHGAPVQQDPQEYELDPDIVLRGWHAGWMDNQPADEYTIGYMKACQDAGMLFMGGLTGSAVFRVDASSEEEFLDWTTRDAQGQLVEHTESGFPMYRGALANPSYRAHLLEKIEMQIDLGVDGIDVDEADGGYGGGQKWMWNGNEGYDDWAIANFNLYLIEKYPGFTEDDWIRTFRMSHDNVIRPELPYTDLEHNFNYRRYLREHGWDRSPRSSANPLAAEFGPVPSQRVSLADDSYSGKSERVYWKQLVLATRAYARDTYGKELLITTNGIFPYVDFDEVGLYDYNRDGEDGGEVNYVPTAGGHLAGSQSLRPAFQRLHAEGQATSGDVPVVVFVDWPGGTMDRYEALSLAEKEDFWQIYVPEAYAAGLHHAFHLKTADPSRPTATSDGILDFLVDYAGFYKAHRELYQGAVPGAREVQVSAAAIAASISEQPAANRWLVHLVNHDYDRGIKARSGLTVTFDTPAAPSSVTLVTPDGAGGALGAPPSGG